MSLNENPPNPIAWTFLTNYSHVLFCIAQDSEIRIREIALRVGITERAVQRILSDLVENGYLESTKEGRRNRYRVHDQMPLRHPLESHRTIGDVLHLILPDDTNGAKISSKPRRRNDERH